MEHRVERANDKMYLTPEYITLPHTHTPVTWSDQAGLDLVSPLPVGQ